MRSWMKLGLVAPVAFAALTAVSGDAEACGGCFVPPSENTLVTGHRMVMSIGMDQSTLYDQVQYTGAPESFAWVLPIKGKVDVGVSSDLVFALLGNDTSVSIAPPPLNCAAYNCYNGAEDGAMGTGVSASGTGGGVPNGVDVIAQEVVGPYETVQLQASDPTALEKWLADHGYQLPSSVQPIVDAYVKDGFNFLAVKLVPGQNVQAMQPIRITTKGMNVALPLRMVAAGTGDLTTITLWVLGDFRAETANFPTFAIAPENVVWDYGQNRSNYTDLRDQAYAASKHFGWLAESATPYSPQGFRSRVQQIVQFNVAQAGYGKDPALAKKAADDDMAVLFHGVDDNGAWVTRLRAELSRPALGTDLSLQAAGAQTTIPRFIQTKKFVGQQPACPPVPPDCQPGVTDPNGGDGFWSKIGVGNKATGGGGNACSFSGEGSPGFALAAGALALALAVSRRRRLER